MDNTRLQYKVRHTAQDTYFIQVWQDEKQIIYTTQEYREAKLALQEAREWVDPTNYSPPLPNNYGRFTPVVQLFRLLTGREADPSYISQKR